VVKIIRRGKDPSLTKYEYTCEDCDSLLEFGPEDRKFDQRENSAYVTCPVCNHFVNWEVVKRDGRAKS
jgi:hypothetical protein